MLRGLATPEQLVKAAAASGIPALALTDVHSLTGSIEFFDACQSYEVQPLLGLELLIKPAHEIALSANTLPGSVVVLAQNLTGWRSLCHLASQSVDIKVSVEQTTEPAEVIPAGASELPLSIERLAQERAGLICLTGGQNGMLWRLLQKQQVDMAADWLSGLHNLFQDSLYVELPVNGDESGQLALARLAKRLKLPLAAAHQVAYLTNDQAYLQRLVSSIRLNTPLTSLPADAAAPLGAWLVPPAEFQRRCEHFPAAIEGTQEIAGRCTLQLPLGKAQFPELELPAGVRPIELLREQSFTGAKQLYPPNGSEAVGLDPAITSRLEHELAVIDRTGYAALFLVMQEIIQFARQQGIPTASRGSASSSLVAHCLGITSPDPVRLNLYFERFLNPARHSPPDIDTDLCSNRRDEVLHFVYRRFGPDRVAMVATINRFRARSALREVAKAHGLSPNEVNELARDLPYRWYGPSTPASDQTPFAELEKRHPDLNSQKIFRDAAALIELPHHLSIHPGGMVIAPGAITDLAPTLLAPKGVRITQFDLDSIERLGLVKIDLLGIRGLSVLGEVAQKLSDQADDRLHLDTFETGQDRNYASTVAISYLSKLAIRSSLSVLDEIPIDDTATAETIRQARTIGCFQIESPGMRATLREIQAHSIDDLMVALALYRPGPLSGGLKDAFVRRHLGKERSTQLHPSLTPLLADTHGVILYQEQVLRIAHELAGLSLADADLLRRAMSHFDPGKQMQTLRMRFIEGAVVHAGVPEEIAARVWELMAAFAGYGFPKAHAASYAVVGWRSAWCKTHHPALFMAAVLANWGGYYSQRVYLTEARRLGLTIRPPQVNYAAQQFSARWLDGKPILFMGLGQVRELTQRTIQRILQHRPFGSLDDFLARVDPRPQEANNLAASGCLAEFGSIPAQLEQIEGGWKAGQLPLFGYAPAEQPDWPLAERMTAQEKILGVAVDAHTLELAAERIRQSGAISTLEAASRQGQRVRIAGMRQTWRRTRTSQEQSLYIMTLEDLEGSLLALIPGEIYRRYKTAFSSPGPYIVEGVIGLDRDQIEPVLRVERVERIL